LPDDLKQKLAFGDDDDDGEGEANGTSVYDQLGSWILSQSEEKGGVAKVEDVDIYVKAKEMGIESKHKTLTVLAQTVFDENIVSQIEPRAAMLKKVRVTLLVSSSTANTHQMVTSERHEKAFLGGLERFLGNAHPDLIPQVPKVLLTVYQEDVIGEETLKNWGSKASKKYVDLATSKKVRKAAEPFLQWLETAESDEESDEDE
jgi:translation initiation factor 5